MTQHHSRKLVSLIVVFGAMVFGMVLAGGLNLTVPGISSPEPAPLPSAQELSPLPLAAVPSFADLVERVSPAVISIEAASFERPGSQRRVDPFEFFFGPRRREQQPDDEEFRSDSGGSGFVIRADGLIVTNNHVIRGAEQVRVRMGENTFNADVKGIDPATDLALLKIETDVELPYLPLGNSENLRVGDWVMAIGSPQGLTNSVTVGVVSAKERRINISRETSSFENFIQTDAAINFGNSGGPLINLRGEVVGINTAINWGSENIGFAVPVNTLDQVLPQLLEEGRVRRGYLGIAVGDVTPQVAEAFGLEASQGGVLVTEVQPGLPAAKSGIQHGDIILKVDDEVVADTRVLIDYVSAQGPDKTVVMELLREGELVKKKVTLSERPTDGVEAESSPGDEEGGIEWLGLRYQNLTPGLRSMHGLPEDLTGVWITEISPRSPLYEEGLRTGNNVISVITEVNGTKVASAVEFERVVKGAESASRLRVYVRRFSGGQEGQPVFVFPAVP
jgi:serine protease Do